MIACDGFSLLEEPPLAIISEEMGICFKKSCGSFLPLQTHLDNKGVVFFQAVVVVVRVTSDVVLVHVGDAVVEQVRALLLVFRPPCGFSILPFYINKICL